MIAAGLLPRLLAAWYPALGKAWVTAAAGSLAVLGAVALSVVRLRGSGGTRSGGRPATAARRHRADPAPASRCAPR